MSRFLDGCRDFLKEEKLMNMERNMIRSADRCSAFGRMVRAQGLNNKGLELGLRLGLDVGVKVLELVA